MINGHYSEKHLCSECARSEDMNILSPMDFLTPFTAPRQRAKRACTKCGMTADAFISGGYLGCSDCYREFGDLTSQMIAQVQKGSRHVGRGPKAREELTERQRLEMELRAAVESEQYLKAAELREKLDRLEGGAV
jgi:protein arginine kinase activator